MYESCREPHSVKIAWNKSAECTVYPFQVYMLGVVDYAETTSERSEYNNGFAVPVTVVCVQGRSCGVFPCFNSFVKLMSLCKQVQLLLFQRISCSNAILFKFVLLATLVL